MNTFDRKLERAKSELDEAGFWPTNAYPPLQSLLGKLGWKTRPPHYAPFLVAFNVAALFFSCIWGGSMWLLVWSAADMPPNRALSTAIISGVFFGLTMALYYAYGRKKHNPTPWDQL